MAKLSEITMNEWLSFCDSYTQQYWGWMMRVDINDCLVAKYQGDTSSLREERVAASLVFQSIIFEDRYHLNQLLLTFTGGSELFTYRMTHPIQIFALATDHGPSGGLLIHDVDGGLLKIGVCEFSRPERSYSYPLNGEKFVEQRL